VYGFVLRYLIVDFDLISTGTGFHIAYLAIVFLQDPELFVYHGFSY
jgi:hypothetical protein